MIRPTFSERSRSRTLVFFKEHVFSAFGPEEILQTFHHHHWGEKKILFLKTLCCTVVGWSLFHPFQKKYMSKS